MKFDTFEQATVFIESYIEKAQQRPYMQGLERISYLLGKLGNPHLAYPTIHVGGTAGKTSTSTMIADILTDSGYKTGLHISPHLEDIRERMQINRGVMTEDKFVAYTNTLMPIVRHIEMETSYGVPSYFEMLLAMTFLYFKDEQVDIAVIEVGLGGKLDGTNVIQPLVVVLTNVGLDHTEILGDTVEEIARDKVGILKKDIPVITGVTQPSVIDIVKQKAVALNCELTIVHNEYEADLPPYQRRNASLAAAAIKSLPKGYTIHQQTIDTVLSREQIPGRFEILRPTINDKPTTIILDGAHNIEKISALKEALIAKYPGQKFRFVFAVKKDKKREDMISILSEIASKFYFTRFFKNADMGKALSVDPSELPPLSSVESEVIEDPNEAIKTAINQNTENEIICVTGSLYLVGELRTTIRKSS